MSWLTSVFWDQALKLKALFYIDRVATDANPGDGPSRDRTREAVACGWEEVQALIPEVVKEGLGKFLKKIRSGADLRFEVLKSLVIDKVMSPIL